MPSRPKRIFTSFAIEDRSLRDMLRGQMRNPSTPIIYTDMSVKEPWANSWKTQCRTRIKGCDGMVAIVTRNTAAADGQLWELKCAYEEGVPVFPIYGSQTNRPARLPTILQRRRIYNWTWNNIASFISRL